MMRAVAVIFAPGGACVYFGYYFCPFADDLCGWHILFPPPPPLPQSPPQSPPQPQQDLHMQLRAKNTLIKKMKKQIASLGGTLPEKMQLKDDDDWVGWLDMSLLHTLLFWLLSGLACLPCYDVRI